MTELDLCNNKIEQISLEICNLTNLTSLDLFYNEIKKIPGEIANLTNLTHLYLSNNKIKSIFPKIGNLINLQELHLENNQIKSIPPEIVNLVNLHHLNLSENPIRSLPSEIIHGKNTPYISLTYHSELPKIPQELVGKIYLNSVLVPEKYCGIDFKDWKAESSVTEENAEVRRLLIQVIGYEKILEELQAVKLDDWREYSLLKIEQDLDLESIVLLKMTCPSTNKIHVLRVPPEMRSAREAIIWVNWGIDPEDFCLET